MKILYLTHSCPYPPNKGDRIRNFNILTHLSQKHDVTLVYPSFSHTDVEGIQFLKPYCQSIKTVRLNPLIKKLQSLFTILGNEPLTISYFKSSRLQNIIINEEYDAALVDCSSMGQYVRKILKPKIIDFVDVDSDKWRLYGESSIFPKSLLYFSEWKRLQKYESCLVNEFDGCLVVSEKEKTFLPPSDNIHVVPNGIDLNYFMPRKNRECNSLIFTGAMNYYPNIDGVLFFHDQILPLIRSKISSAKFVIAGMAPSRCIKNLQNSNTVVTGMVPDIRNYLGSASVCVVPLRIAKGIQNKVLEAMAMGIPVVATSAANNGIQARNQKEILIADSPETFADAVIKLLRNEELANDLSRRARKFVEKRFAWPESLKGLDKALELLPVQSKQSGRRPCGLKAEMESPLNSCR